MALELPYVHVRLGESKPRVESMSRPTPLSPDDLGHLLHLDAYTQPRQPPGDRALPLDGGLWAVGRGGFGGVTWRIMDQEQAAGIAHPAWLWRSSRWFDPTAPPRGPAPSSLPLRAQLDPAARLGGSPMRTAGLLASCVARLRAHDAPVAVVVDPSQVADPAPAGRWLLLALLTLLPQDMASRLRISTFEHDPAPEDWDVVVASSPPRGFAHIRPEAQPPLGGDVPATFILERLLDDDPELAAEAATWGDGSGGDAWATAIRLRRPSNRTLTPGLGGRRSAEPGATRDTPRRLGLNTAEAWLSLADRSDHERARIIDGWLGHEDAPPTDEVLDAVAAIRPAGQDVVGWCTALLRWCEEGPSRTVAARLLGDVLDGEALPLEPSTRASLFTELVRVHLELGHFDEALAVLSSPAAHTLSASGAGQVVADAWLRLPNSRRPLEALNSMVSMLLESPDGDEAVSHLWQALMVQERDARADHVLQLVAQRALHEPGLRLDGITSVLAESPQAMRWVGHVARSAPPDRLRALVAPVTRGPDDPLWEHCVDVRSQHASPEDRIADLVGLPEQQVSRLERELRRAAASVRVWRFPDVSVAEGAARLADLAERSPLWLWLHVCATPPQANRDGIVPKIVIAYCTRPPNTHDERRAAISMAEGLGLAEGWTPASHAELLLRLALAPDGDGTRPADDLAAGIARGLGRRHDAGPHMAELTEELAALPADHPALMSFLNRLLPLAFSRGVPGDYVSSTRYNRWPGQTRDAWLRIIDSLGQR